MILLNCHRDFLNGTNFAVNLVKDYIWRKQWDLKN